jgi:hypothetical protein
LSVGPYFLNFTKEKTKTFSLKALQKGSIPLMHTENYHHRSRNKELEKDSKGILVKRF